MAQALPRVTASHPVWVCGLKHQAYCSEVESLRVTPCMGVWIETVVIKQKIIQRKVTPCMGVWIETC